MRLRCAASEEYSHLWPDLGSFRRPVRGRHLVTDGAAAAAWRKQAGRCICNALSVPAQSDRDFFGKAGACGSSKYPALGSGASSVGGRSDGPVRRFLDIKPYLPHVDSHAEALGQLYGKDEGILYSPLKFTDELLEKIPADRREALTKVLEQDPAPIDIRTVKERVYGLSFAGMEIKIPDKGPGAACRGGRARRET